MESTKLLASGLTLEESKAKRQEKQAARYRHRLGTYVPSGDSNGLLEALMATSPRKSPTPRRSTASRSTKPRKSTKSSEKVGADEDAANGSAQGAKQTEHRASTSRKSKITESTRMPNQTERRDKNVSRKSMGKTKVHSIKDGAKSESSALHQTDETASTVDSKAPRKPGIKKNSKRSKPSSRAAGPVTDPENQLTTPKPHQARPKKPLVEPPPTQTDDESDDLAIKKPKSPRKVNKGKARATDFPTFESAGTDVDAEVAVPGPPNARFLSTEGKSLRDPPPTDIHRTISDQGDSSGEERRRKPPPKKRSHPRNDEGAEEPLPKKGRLQKPDSDGEGKNIARTKPARQSRKVPPKPKTKTTKGRVGKMGDVPHTVGDGERKEPVSPETMNTRKPKQRKSVDRFDDQRWNEPDHDDASSNRNRVRLDSIPPEGIIIRKKNGIVERLLPPAIKPKKRAPSSRGKTRSSRKRVIPAHVLKYIGPTRIGSPLRGTDTDDDLNL